MSTIIKDQQVMMEEIRKLVSEGNTVSICAKGYSMNPFIMHMRDQITLGPWTDEQIKKGAVVLVKDLRGNFLIHRIIRRDGDVLTLMGDGNVGLKEKAHVKDVIALMHGVIRKGRTYTVRSCAWRLYSWFWKLLTPVRRYPLALWRRMNPQQPLR